MAYLRSPAEQRIHDAADEPLAYAEARTHDGGSGQTLGDASTDSRLTLNVPA